MKVLDSAATKRRQQQNDDGTHGVTSQLAKDVLLLCLL